jgi:acyl dehydratase
VFRHELHRAVIETDNLLVTALTHNPPPLHLDAEYASTTEFGQIVVNELFTFALMVGLSVGNPTLGTLVANLGYDAVIMPKPVFIGDTVRAETTVLEKRDRISHPAAGLVIFERISFYYRNELLCQCNRTALMHRKPR